MEEKKIFKQGDFIKRNNKKGSFMIYEGINVSDSTLKKMSLIASYDPEKFMQTPMGYDHIPHLDVSSSKRRCEDTIDTEKEDFWISLCSDIEKDEAKKVLAEYGYLWDEENLSMIDTSTGEIIKKIIVPDNSYHGQIIKPITQDFKDILKKFCIEKNKKETYTSSYQRYWDEYGD